MAHKVAVYIDGFNLHYGLRDKGWSRFYWLDIYRLAENLLRSDQELSVVRYFTAPLLSGGGNDGRVQSHTTYLEALATLSHLSIQRGYYTSKSQDCTNCGKTTTIYEEKTTDVNIAVAMLTDAYDNLYDTAILVSADGDLVRPVVTILERFPTKRVVAAFPPCRHSFHLRSEATASFIIGRRVVAKSQLPDSIVSQDGYTLSRPQNWI